MRTLYLHVGMGKTGTSFLQASLANSVNALVAQGVEYFNGAEGPARDWGISSGNGPQLVEAPVEAFQFSADKVLFSFEGLFGLLATRPPFREKLAEIAVAQGIGAVRILMLIRDPVAHAESCYQQDVKRLGATYDVARYFQGYRMPEFGRMLLEADLGLPAVEIEVLHYQRHRADLLGVMARFLGVPVGTLAAGPKHPINRSLTRAELALQLALNRQLGQGACFFSDHLCAALPGEPSEPSFPPVRVQEAMLTRLRPTLEAVNAHLPVEERYLEDITDPGAEARPLSAAQLQEVGTILGQRLGQSQHDLIVVRAERLQNLAELSFERGDMDVARRRLAAAEAQLGALRQVRHDPATVERLTTTQAALSARIGPA